MRSDKVSFTNSRGTQLAARFDLPSMEPVGYALMAHCFSCSKDVLAMTHISESLVARGIGVLRFDFTGLGQSMGEFADSHFSANIDDIRSAVGFMSAQGKSPLLMLGHSLGGTAILATAHEVSSAKIVATIGSPYEPAHAEHFFDGLRENMEAGGEVCVTLGGRKFTVTREFIEDLDDHRMNEAIRSISGHVVVFHDPDDALVERENAKKIYQSATHPKSFISLPGAGHMLTKEADAELVASILDAFIKKLLA
ncbi:MAG: lysophospholipase [Rickettsiales bacterium]|nr:lysophospholipase [Rickettsiales bacterium]